MSTFIRWHSGSAASDVYAYRDPRGYYVTHVAGYRARLWWHILHWLGGWKRLSVEEYTLPKWVTHKRLRLPAAGKSFYDRNEEHMRQRLTALKKAGFRVP